MKLKTLSGKPVHPIGIGTWGFGGTWEPEYGKEQQAIDSIHYSISKGQNHIDGAQIYGGGHTDEIIGQAIKNLKRKDLFVTDKVWETNVAKGTVRPAVETMLKKLGTDYLDALYIHKPWDDFPWREAIPQIDELIDEGVVRYFGISNFNTDQAKETQSLSKHPITLSQIHFNVIHKENLDAEAKVFYADNDVQVIAYKPLERGAVLENKVLGQIAKAHHVTPAQVAIAWLFAQQTLPLPQASKELFIDQNLAAMELKLSPEQVAQLDKL